MATYVLPDLSYDYGALEPHISGEIVELHHGKHHAAYVKGANTALEQLAQARAQKDFAKIAGLERALAFNVSGHVLHSLFWRNLSPDGGDAPQGGLAEAIRRDLGDLSGFKTQMIEAATTTMGSGWAALIYEPLSESLLVTQIHDHQNQQAQGGVPLMVLDAWEHAYYLQYQTEKAKYFEAIWNLWNWDDIAARFARARSADLGLDGDVIRKPESGRRRGKAEPPTIGLD